LRWDVIAGRASRDFGNAPMLRPTCYASDVHRSGTRIGARALLIAALAMVIDTACSQAPPPSANADVHDTARNFQSKHAVARFHLVDGTTYATSSYAVADSFVVIKEILRDAKYYGPTSEHLYGKSDVTPPPKTVAPPVKIPMRQISSVEQWQSTVVSNDSKKGLLIVGGIVVGLVAALVIVIVQNND
jgi:hypothetical protein